MQSGAGDGLLPLSEASQALTHIPTAHIVDGLVTVTPIHTSNVVISTAAPTGRNTMAQHSTSVDPSQIFNLVFSTGQPQSSATGISPSPIAPVTIAPSPALAPLSQPQTVQQLLAAAAAARQQQQQQQQQQQLVQNLARIGGTNIQGNGKTVTFLQSSSELQALLQGIQQQGSPQSSSPSHVNQTVLPAPPSASPPEPGVPLQAKPGTKSQGDLQRMMVKAEEPRRASTGSLLAQNKRQGGFLIPKVCTRAHAQTHSCVDTYTLLIQRSGRCVCETKCKEWFGSTVVLSFSGAIPLVNQR